MATARYNVVILRPALKELQSLPRATAARVTERIHDLADEPRPQGAKSLKGRHRGYWRLRVGDYRIIYRIEDDRLLVVVVTVGHRGDVYR